MEGKVVRLLEDILMNEDRPVQLLLEQVERFKLRLEGRPNYLRSHRTKAGHLEDLLQDERLLEAADAPEGPTDFPLQNGRGRFGGVPGLGAAPRRFEAVG